MVNFNLFVHVVSFGNEFEEDSVYSDLRMRRFLRKTLQASKKMCCLNSGAKILMDEDKQLGLDAFSLQILFFTIYRR